MRNTFTKLVDTLAKAKRGSVGVLRVGLTVCLAHGFLTELLAAYHRRFPAIEPLEANLLNDVS